METKGQAMPLYIKDESVNELAVHVVRLTGAKDKTDAVRRALLAQLNAVKQQKPLLERIEELRTKTNEIGPKNPDFDMKSFSDEMHEA
jgi:antitoxin VapB